MTVWGEQGMLKRPSLRVMRCRNGNLSGSNLAHEPRLGTARTYQCGEMPLPTETRSGLRRERYQVFYQELSSKAASSGSQLKTAMPPKRSRVDKEVQTNEIMEDLTETRGELERVRKMLVGAQED